MCIYVHYCSVGILVYHCELNSFTHIQLVIVKLAKTTANQLIAPMDVEHVLEYLMNR